MCRGRTAGAGDPPHILRLPWVSWGSGRAQSVGCARRRWGCRVLWGRGGGTWVRVGVPDQKLGGPGPWTRGWPAVGATKLRPRALPGFPPPRLLPPRPRGRARSQPRRHSLPGHHRRRGRRCHPRRPEPQWETGMTATPGERRGRPAAAPSPARSVSPASVSLGGWGRPGAAGTRLGGTGGGPPGDRKPWSGRRREGEDPASPRRVAVPEKAERATVSWRGGAG